MKHQAIKFTDERIRKLKPAPGQRECTKYDTDVHKLFVRASQNGKKTFYVRLNRKVYIGRHPTLNVEQARQKAKDLIHRYDHGEDVAVEYRTRRQRRVEARTFEDVIEAYRKANPNDASLKHRDKTSRLIRLHFQTVLKHPFADLDADTLQDCLGKIQGRRGAAPSTSQYLNAILNWAADEYSIPNILAGKRQKKRLPKMPRARRVFLPGEVMPKVFQTARDGLPSPVGELLQFLIYIPVRCHEAAAARWSEFNEALTEWTIPASPGRMKGGEAAEPLVVPLPPHVTELLRKIKRHAGSDYVFTYTGRCPMSGFGRYKRLLDKALADAGINPPKWRLHDLRRSFNMWAMSRAKDFAFNVHAVADRCLGHVTHKGVQGVYTPYEYIDERRELLAAWATYLTELEPKSEASEPEIPPPPVAQSVDWHWTVNVGGKTQSSTTLVPARPPLAYLNFEPVPAELVEIGLLYRAIACHPEAQAQVNRVWALNELDYKDEFFETHGLDSENAAMAAVQQLVDMAMELALGKYSVVTRKVVKAARAELEALRDKWQRWAATDGPDWCDPSINRTTAKSMAESYARKLANLPKEGSPLLVDRSRGGLEDSLPIAEGVQRILFAAMKEIFRKPSAELATALAKAVTGAPLTRWQLREFKAG
jgi:integrase